MTSADGAELLLGRHGHVMIARLNRPAARNALTRTMIDELGAALIAAEADPTVRALLLTGAGDHVFCAGTDPRAFTAGADFLTGPHYAAFVRLAMGRHSLPVIGAANGTAVNGGLELLLGSDVIIASATAKFGFPETARGLSPGSGNASIGIKIALGPAVSLLLSGELITAEQAHRIGLVATVTAPDEVFETALALAETMAAAPLDPDAVDEPARATRTDTARDTRRLSYWQSVIGTETDVSSARSFLEEREPRREDR
ncbi:enoyl-CoA hydratase/isomerase family protein [Nocardia salmonicida]|uniref:enoyl-CoA hydratase/isomerase family protein n=1 Tax=Nocardia salmonicida TaxID=53431 RepID=UPI0037209A73